MPVVALPWVMAGAVLAALAVVAIHLLALDRPPVVPFPPARFLAGTPARAAARRRRPQDLLLLAVRVVLLLAAGAALSGVRWDPPGPRTLRLVIADSATAGTDPAWAPAANAAGARLLRVAGLAEDPGRALAAAQRAAAEAVAAHPRATAVALEVRLPPRVRDLAGWAAWRPLWPGRVTVQPTQGSAWPVTPPDSEPLPRVSWPRDGVPVGWEPLMRPDSVGAWGAFGVVLVGPWERRSRWRDASAAVPVAWWSDGAVAAVERPRADGGCERTVAVPHPAGSDLLAAPAALALRRALALPCGGRAITQALADSLAGSLAGSLADSPTGHGAAQDAADAPAAAFAVPASGGGRPWPPSLGHALWLVALLAVVAETVLRWRWRGAVA